MKSSKTISAVVAVTIVASSLLLALPANAAGGGHWGAGGGHWGAGGGHWGAGGGRWGAGGGRWGAGGGNWGGGRWGGRWGHNHWGWGGALAGAAIVGAIATAAAANQGNCQLAIYDGAGNFIGYRQGNC